MSSTSGRKEGLRCPVVVYCDPFMTCDRLLLEKDSKLGLGVRCDRCKGFHPLPVLLREAVKQGLLTREAILEAIAEPNQKEKQEEEMKGKKIEGLKKIIKKTVKDAAKDKEIITVIELTMVGGNGPYHDRYTFSADRFIKIQGEMVVFNDYTGESNVPLDNVECVTVRKVFKRNERKIGRMGPP